MTTALSRTGFDVELSDHPLEPNLPQKAGNRLWLPMLAMALTGFAAGIVLAVIRANEISTGGAADTVAALAQFVPAAMFLGFASVFAAISFAIARILGGFRTSGGAVQQSAGATVETLRTPKTAKAFILGMAMAMMTILAAVVIHIVVGVGVLSDTYSVTTAEQAGIWLEGVRRIGVAIYLFAISLGLGTIIHVLRFQSIRIRELPGEAS